MKKLFILGLILALVFIINQSFSDDTDPNNGWGDFGGPGSVEDSGPSSHLASVRGTLSGNWLTISYNYEYVNNVKPAYFEETYIQKTNINYFTVGSSGWGECNVGDYGLCLNFGKDEWLRISCLSEQERQQIKQLIMR